VTGASRGIGAAIAQRLAAEGADVAITARTKDRHPTLPGSLDDTAALLAAHGSRVGVIVADMADADDRARIVPEAEAALGGPVEILVNNAAAAIYQPLSDYPLRRRRLLFEVNVHGPIDLAQAALPAMLRAGEGWIVKRVERLGPPRRRTAVCRDHHVEHDRRVRRVEGCAQPAHERARGRGVRHRRAREHR
jgi:NAD(P)-dependent dehydrogenase (short-subunit alcohol dehydrogenase family)